MKDAGDGIAFLDISTWKQGNKKKDLPGVESMLPGGKQEKNLKLEG